MYRPGLEIMWADEAETRVGLLYPTVTQQPAEVTPSALHVAGAVHPDQIVVARENNLKDLSVDIPKRQLTVFRRQPTGRVGRMGLGLWRLGGGARG